MSYVQPNSSILMGLECDFNVECDSNVVSASMYNAQKRLLGRGSEETREGHSHSLWA